MGDSYCCIVAYNNTSCSGEELWETAIRETWEETGVRSEFVSMLCFRHMHGYRWGTDDIYFACLLRPLSTDITADPSEIADAKWMDVRIYALFSSVHYLFFTLLAEKFNVYVLYMYIMYCSVPAFTITGLCVDF